MATFNEELISHVIQAKDKTVQYLEATSVVRAFGIDANDTAGRNIRSLMEDIDFLPMIMAKKVGAKPRTNEHKYAVIMNDDHLSLFCTKFHAKFHARLGLNNADSLKAILAPYMGAVTAEQKVDEVVIVHRPSEAAKRKIQEQERRIEQLQEEVTHSKSVISDLLRQA